MQQPDRGLVMLFSRQYSPGVGGADASVHNMAHALLRQGFRVRLYVGAQADLSEISRPGLTTLRIAERTVGGRHAPFVSWWLTQRHLSRLLNRELERPVAVHVFDATFGRAAVNWARRNGIRSVVTLTSDDVRVGTGATAAVRNFIIGRTLRHAGLITSPSRLLAEIAQESRGARDVHVVPHGIDFTASAGVENAFHVRRKFGIPADAFVFLSVQQLYPGKTPVNAVRAFASTTTERRHAYLLIAGDGPGRAAVERVAQETGVGDRVLLAGEIPADDVVAYMRAADAFVVDTAFEPFSSEAVQAMAAGLPVIGTRSGALPEVIEDGRTGLLSRFGDIDSMANDMRRVMTNPELREHLRVEARRTAASFDWSSIAEQYTSGYGAA